MSKSLKYVKDFEFPSDCGFTGSAGSQMVKGYARGGAAKTPAAPKSERKEMARVMRETSSERKGAGAEVKRVSREESYDQAKVSSPAKPARKSYPAHSNVPMIALKKGGMIPSTGKLGVVNNKNPGETKKHTAPDLAKPKTMMKSGGSVKKMADGGVASAAAKFQDDQSKMSGDAMRSIGQQAMLRGQKMNTSGQQLGRPGQPMPRPGLAVDPAPPRPRGGPGNPTPYDQFMMSPKMQEQMKQQSMQRQGINQGDIDRMRKLQMSGDPSFESESAALNARMNANEQQSMQRGQPQVGRMPGNAMTRDQQMQQAQQMLQTNRPAGMGMGQQVAQQMPQTQMQSQQQMAQQMLQMQAQQQMAQQRPQVPMQQAQQMLQTNRPAGMGMGQQVAQQRPQTQMQSQQQMAQQRPQVPMQQAQPMKKGGMTYKKK